MSPFSMIVRIATALGLLLTALVSAQAQVAGAPLIPELIANNDCDNGRPCVRQMLQLKQFTPRQQSQLLWMLGRMPTQPASSGASTSCTTHNGGGHAIIVCLDIRAEGTCSCVLTTSGSACIGTNPYCPASLN